MNNPIVSVIEYGSLAKITRHIPADDHNHTLHEGQLIEIAEYVSADESDDGVPFYWANSHGTGNMNDICVNADSVELVRGGLLMLPDPVPASLLPLNDPPARHRISPATVFIWSCVTPFAALVFVVIADMEWW